MRARRLENWVIGGWRSGPRDRSVLERLREDLPIVLCAGSTTCRGSGRCTGPSQHDRGRWRAFAASASPVKLIVPVSAVFFSCIPTMLWRASSCRGLSSPTIATHVSASTSRLTFDRKQTTKKRKSKRLKAGTEKSIMQCNFVIQNVLLSSLASLLLQVAYHANQTTSPRRCGHSPRTRSRRSQAADDLGRPVTTHDTAADHVGARRRSGNGRARTRTVARSAAGWAALAVSALASRYPASMSVAVE